MIPRNFFLPALGAGLLALGFLGSCAEEETRFQGHQPEVVVRLAPTYQPQGGIKVVVMDPATNLAAAGPQVSGSDGTCEFPGLGAGDYRLMAFGGAAYQVVSNLEALRVGGKSPLASWSGVPEKTPPDPLPTLILVSLRQTAGGLPRIAGQVVDQVSGEPLAGAFVSTSPFLEGYSGGTTYKDDVTLADGRFTVSEIVFAPDPGSGNLSQVEPLLVTCAGYRPLAWTHQMANGDNNLDISGVTIALTPVQPGDTGRLSGRLLLGGEPVSGVRVGLGGMGSDKSGAGQPGYAVETGDEGLFQFTGLPAGTYFVHPGFPAHDGYVYPNQPGNVGYAVASGQETTTEDLSVLTEVRLTYPPNGWGYFGPEWIEPLSWLPVPEADRYQVFLDRGVLGETDTTMIDIPEDWTLGPGQHHWSVQAYNAQDEVIGATEVTGLFFIVDQPSD